MNSKVGPGCGADYQIDRNVPRLGPDIRHIGLFEIDVCRPDGSVREHHTIKNKLTNGGVAYMLNRAFFVEASAPFAAVNTAVSNGAGWYLGLIETNPNPGTGLSDSDDMNNVLGVPVTPLWDDFANYNSAARALYKYDNANAGLAEIETRASTGIPTARSISNPTQITIAITAGASVAVGGVYMINIADATYSAATSLLFSTANFGTEPVVSSGDSLKVTYTHSFGASTDLG